MFEWKTFPFVRIIIPFIAGILTLLLLDVHVPVAVLFVSLLLAIALHIFFRHKSFRIYARTWLIGLLFQTAIFLLGNELAYLHIDSNQNDHYTHFLEKGNQAVVRLLEPPAEKDKSWKALVEVNAIVSGSGDYKTCGKAILYLQRDSSLLPLRYGDLLLIKNNLEEIPAPKNPDEFDYKKYLYNNNIYTSAYLRSNEWKKLPFHHSNPLFVFTFWLRDKSVAAFQKYIPGSKEAAIAEAIIVGDRDHLSQETRQSYAAAGVIHVLVVAGLHVGILYLLLNWLFSFLDRRKGGKRLKVFLITILIWLFALLTGFSAPVIRAASMFTFINIGKNLNRTVSTRNILACSAFVMLLFNPLLIIDAGFQLSYAAVTGITELYPHINRWINSSNKIIDKIWSTMAVSLAAQIGTLPFTTFYFNQFPTLFLIANLVVVPLSAIVLYAGVFLSVFQFVPPIAHLLGYIMYGFIYFLNTFISNITRLPFAVIHLSAFQVYQPVLLSLLIILITRFFVARRRIAVPGIAITGIALFSFQVLNELRHFDQKSITLYSFPKKSCLQFDDGTGVALVKSGDTFSDQENYYLQYHWQLMGVNKITSITEDSNTNNLSNKLLIRQGFYQFYNYRLAVVRNKLLPNTTARKIKLDALVLSENPDVKLRDVLSWFDAPMIIIDGNNAPYKRSQWKKEAQQLSVNTYDVIKQGAFTVSL